MPVAILTGASRGLGLALARALSERGWRVVVDARDGSALADAVAGLAGAGAIPGDVTDAEHRRALVDAAGGRINLLVNNASRLGPSPQPALADYPLAELARVYEANLFAPLGLVQLALPRLAPGAAIVNITSDAGAEAYEGWGGYGSSKAALDQLTAILAAEHPELRVYAVDPGDMRTQMQQDAFPGEDISDRPPPEESVPGLLELVHARFRDLPRFLEPGDLLVVNTSATLPASLPADGLELRLSTQVGPDRWLVELRTSARERFRGGREGARIALPEGRSAELLARHAGGRLWLARVAIDEDYLRRHGRPIRYGYVPKAWPLEAYQTVFAREPGSAEMPSAGRPFTAELVTKLVTAGGGGGPPRPPTGASPPGRGGGPCPPRYRRPG